MTISHLMWMIFEYTRKKSANCTCSNTQTPYFLGTKWIDLKITKWNYKLRSSRSKTQMQIQPQTLLLDLRGRPTTMSSHFIKQKRPRRCCSCLANTASTHVPPRNARRPSSEIQADAVRNLERRHVAGVWKDQPRRGPCLRKVRGQEVVWLGEGGHKWVVQLPAFSGGDSHLSTLQELALLLVRVLVATQGLRVGELTAAVLALELPAVGFWRPGWWRLCWMRIRIISKNIFFYALFQLWWWWYVDAKEL